MYNFRIVYFLLYIVCICSFTSKLLIRSNSLSNKYLSMNSHETLEYITSIKEYTIIAVGDKHKYLQEEMINNNMNTYYINLNNIFDKNELLDILKERYKYFDNSKQLWIFHKNYLIGSKEDVYKIFKDNLF